MEYTHPLTREATSDLAPAVTEVVRSTLRAVIVITSSAYLICCFVAAAVVPESVDSRFFLLAGLVLVISAASLRLLAERLLAGEIVWLAGIAAGITLAVYASQRAEVVFVYAFLPLVAVVTINWEAGLLVGGAVTGLVWWLAHSPAMPPIPGAYGVATVIGGGFAGLLGWAVTRALLTTTEWSLLYCQQAREQMEAAREQRLELKQVQEDLVHANRELARLSERLEAMHRVAEAARRAKEEFVANVSHELRTPLNMIIGFSEMITQSPQVYSDRLPPALLSDITAIQRNSRHLARLVDDVLDLSQVEAGRMALSKEWISPQELVDEAAQVVQALFQSKGLDLGVDVAADLPPVFCDGTRIRQVVINLLSNAGRFTEQGGVRVRVWRAEGRVMFSVADTGPGIELEDQERIFEPFQQVDSSIRRRHGGSGLGLAISKRFVEMHEGEMWLDSEVGVGTTFYFSLPLEVPSHAAETGDDVRRWFSPYHQYEPRTRPFKAPVARLPPRFVVLETGDVLLRMFNRYVGEVEVVSARDMRAAKVELARSPAQALVVNAPAFLETPALLSQLSDLPYATPAVTCWVPGEGQAARQLGAVRYLVKPISREVLFSALEGLERSVRTVLLVDDEPEVLQLFTRLLLSAGRDYDVLQAKSGRRALSLLRGRHPDVMLLDLIMPGMDGLEVLREKSQDPAVRDIPVVVISSRDPGGEPLASDTLTVTRRGGLSVGELLDCIGAVSEVLSPGGASLGP